MSLRSFLPAVCALAALAGPASAQFASADVSGLRYELIDLDPNDGIIPEIVFTGPSTLVSGELYTRADGLASEQLTTPGAIEIGRPYGRTHASAAETAVTSRTDLFAASGLYTRFVSYASHKASFTLTPHTGLRLSAAGSLDVAATGWADTYGLIILNGTLSDSVAPVSDTQSFNDQYLTSHGKESFELSGYLNTSERAASGTFSIFSYTSAQVTTVPEPSTWGMLLAGLALVGARLRRRAGNPGKPPPGAP